ncbi:MAG: glycosyltransferase [Ruminococcus sp.]|nr:glycosyltransferase [Ruminococcus sp.]
MYKVCHMTSAHKSNDVRIFVKECSSLAKAGYDTYLVARGESREENGVHVIGVGEPGGRLSRATSFAAKVYKTALALDADVYHFHDPELIPWGLKLKRKGKKVIFDSHERYTEQILCKEEYLPKFALKFIAGGYGVYEKYALRRFDAVVFPCKIGGKNPFKRLCRRTAIIGNPVVLSEFYDLYDPNLKPDEDAVCYIGGLTEDRGITNDVKACHEAGVKLLLAGDFSPESYGEKVKNMPEYSSVEHLGFLDREGVRLAMQRCRAGLYTLRDRGQYFKIDTFGIKVYEYMSMALPVVLSDCEYNRKMTEKYKFGICVDPEDPSAIAAAIRKIIDDPEAARVMGENGRKAVAERFNWGIEEKRLFKLYESVLRK